MQQQVPPTIISQPVVSIPAPNGSVDRHYVGKRISNYCEREVYNNDKGDVPLL
jgi:hypothetical protein